MGNRVAQGPYVGLLVPSDIVQHANLRVNDGTTGNSAYTQAGPQPGVPEYDQDEVASSSSTAGDYGPSMSMDALGEMGANDAYHLKALKGGFPGQNVTLARRDSLTSGHWRGWNTHNVIGHIERDYLLNRAGTGGTNVSYTQVTTADNQAMAVWWDGMQIKCRKYDPDGRTAGAEVVIVDVAAAAINDDGSSYDNFGTTSNVLDALRLPSGRLIVYYLTREVDGAANTAQLWAAYSDDNGATWRTGQYLGLDAPLDVSGGVYKLRAAYVNEGVVLFIELGWLVEQTPYRGIVQYGSDDAGLNFVKVRDEQELGTTDNNSHIDVVVSEADGTFVVVWEQDINNFLRFNRLASPFTPFVQDAQTMVSSVAPNHIVAYSDPGGWLYCTFDDSDGVELYYSRDGGVSWAIVEPVFNHNESTNTFVWDITVAKGRAVWIIGQTASNGGALPLTDHKMWWMECGGWNTLCQPRVLGTDPTVNRGFGSVSSPEAGVWFPSDKPEDFGFNLTGTTRTPSGGVLGLNLHTSPSVYDVAPTAAVTDGLECFFALELGSGGSVSSLDVGLAIILDTLDIEVRFSGTQVRIYDNHAAAAVGTASPSGGMANHHVFKLALRQDNAPGTKNVTLYRRSPDNDVWETLISGTLTGGASATNSIKWGYHANSANSTWSFFAWVADTGSGNTGDYFDDLAQDVLGDDPYILYGAPLPVPPFKLYVNGGLFVRATSGPAYRGDTFKIEPRFDHPVANIDWRNSATPWTGTRTVGTGATTYAWDATLDATLGSTSIGMFLGGINFADAELLGWNGAAWVTLAALSTKLGPGLPCTVTGDTVIVNTGLSSSERYIQYGEFVGGYVKFSGGDIRKIIWNSEGTWTDQATKRPVFRFEGGAPAGATTTCELWHPSATVLLHENTTIYDRYALHIPSQSTYEGYFKVGVCLIGAVVFFGWKPARGRVIELEPNADLRQDLAGRRAGRKLGRSRRSVVLAWSERDLTEISAASPNPDYISLRPGTAEVADRFGTALLLEGLLRDLGGPTKPVVYLPRIPETTVSDKVTELRGRSDHIYGRIVQGLTRSAPLGTELESEVVTLSGFRLEEEV